MPGLYENLQNSRLCPLPRGVGVDALHPPPPLPILPLGEGRRDSIRKLTSP